MEPKPDRDHVLYANVKEVNHEFIKRQAKAMGYPVSEYMDHLIDDMRAKAAKGKKVAGKKR